MTQMIPPPEKPPTDYYSYSNPESQGALMMHTAGFPIKYELDRAQFDRAIKSGMPMDSYFDPWSNPMGPPQKMVRVPVPKGMKYNAAYIDRMREWDSKKFIAAWALIKDKVRNGLRNINDADLRKFLSAYWDVEVKEARIDYYYNVATGYSCEVFHYLYKEKSNPPEVSVDTEES